MALYSVAYRMRLYKPRSLVAAETTVLTPVAGAPHSDNCQIATVSNLSGYKGYMGIPTGRMGKLDVLNRKLDQGQITVPIQDQSLTPGSNINRWFTAFLGSLSGTAQILGVRAEIDEALDWNPVTATGTWNRYFTGRLDKVQLNSSRIITALVLKDLSSELNTQVFVGRAEASVSYVIYPSVLPVGLASAFGTIGAVTRLNGTFGTTTISRTITLTGGSFGRQDNFLTTSLIPSFGLGQRGVVPGLRVRFTTAGVTDKEAEVIGIDWNVQGVTPSVVRLYLEPVKETSDPYYQGLTTAASPTGIPDTTACTFIILQRNLASPGGQQGSSLLLSDAHPVQVWADLLDGKFSRLKSDGSVARTFPRNASAFSTLIADTSFPVCRFVIPEPAKMQDWIEKNILHPFGLGCYLNESGEVVPVDLRPPQSSPTSTTITNADLDSSFIPDWSIDRESAVSVLQVRTYRDTKLEVADLKKQGNLPVVPPALLDRSVQVEYVFPFFSEATLGAADFGERTHVVDIQGLRAFANEAYGALSRDKWIEGISSEPASFFKPLFGYGPQYLTIKCRRTANTNGVQPGTWRLIDIDEVPGLSSYVRGENRLMLCVESTPNGLTRTLRFLDAGPNTVASQPSVATPAQEGSNTKHGITVAVTLNAGSEEAVLWINPTATSVGSRPADSDPGWRQVIPVGQRNPWLTSSATYTVRNLPSDKRIWVRVRTDPVLGKKLSSAWAYPAGTGYVATAAMTAPSALASGTVTTKAAILTWTVGEATERVYIRRFGAASQVAADAGTPVDFLELPAGTTRLQVDGLDSGGPWWHFDVYHKDGQGGVSSVNNLAAFQATGTAATAPTPGGLVVLRSQATNPTPPPTDGGILVVGKPGIQVGIVPAPTGIGLDVELYRAPDSGGSPGSYALIATIPGRQIGGTIYPYNDLLAQDNATYWYKCRHIGNGFTAGSYTVDVSAVPGWLNPEAFTVPGEPVLGQDVTIFLHGGMFSPDTDAIQFDRSTTGIGPRVTATNQDYWCATAIPIGAVITSWTIYGVRTGASDVLTGNLYETTGVGGFTVIDTVICGTGAPTSGTGTPGWTVRSAFINVIMSMRANSSVGDNRLYGVSITYRKSSYQQNL